MTGDEKAALRSFTSAKMMWQQQVAGDAAIPHLCFRIAFLISGHVNEKTSTSWPSQSLLADQLQVTVRSIQIATTTLVAAGYLLVEVGKGRGNTNQYQLAL